MGEETTKEDLELQLLAQTFRFNSGIRYSYEYKKMIVKKVLEEQQILHMGFLRTRISSRTFFLTGRIKYG